ncbi:PSP1-domain-containing protein [Coprinopsis marcescibilis]|uniref:PSP1-domain-containing protein n=1 Tax=Coprinopsis marcescibilis TaxID=230819 RepID=A0A5C3LIM0_COPMA|nr:PSP1-domain-containing protein [Coprinopsis marcescibilis]
MATLEQDLEELYPHFGTYSGRLAHQAYPSDDEERRSRFQSSSYTENGTASLRERAASQPPRNSEQGYLSSPSSQNFIPSSLSSGGSPWTSSRIVNANANTRGQPVPIRSSSFSSQPQTQFSSMMRERAFPSTFEDDESEGFEDTYDERYVPPSLSRGRSYAQDISRSRSQSLANTRAGIVGSPYTGSSAMQSWNEGYLTNSNPLNIPGGRGGYVDIPPSGTSRYGSLGTLARSPSNNHDYSSSPTGGNGYSRHQPDVSNMSPFRRDVGQILLDDGPFRELWAGMNPPRDESGGGGGSGTTSRRHSVSVVQPRRGNIVGFNAPGSESPEEMTSRPTYGSGFGRSKLMINDDDLASDLGMLNLSSKEPPPPSSHHHHPPSQPASLPIYAPLSRSPVSKELFQPIINIPTGSYSGSRQIGTPSDGGLSAGGNGNQSPTLNNQFYDREAQYFSSNKSSSRPQQQQQHQQQQQTQAQSELTARYVPGHGIQYVSNAQNSGTSNNTPTPTSSINTNVGPGSHYVRARAPSYTNQANLSSPISPTGTRLINPQQQPFYPQQMQRRSSNAHESAANAQASAQNQGQAPINELGKGVPLHAIPASCPLYIVQFKAGRTDLFYSTDAGQDIRIGDLVIVEADRGKDLGEVVNDTITLAEVELFQQQQAERTGGGGGGGFGADGQPTSPGGAGSQKKEINPKMIYGKAGPDDTRLLAAKSQDEQKALQLCQNKVKSKKLPMEVIDAEYQWDRRKLTFYFTAEKRIDFRELVRELFRLYKTRIWMASLQGPGGFDQQ